MPVVIASLELLTSVASSTAPVFTCRSLVLMTTADLAIVVTSTPLDVSVIIACSVQLALNRTPWWFF